MSTDAVSQHGPLSSFEQLRYAREIVRAEGQALLLLAEKIQDEFCQAADLIFACRGNVIVSGMGKAGLIGQKIAATLASTGTRSHFLHPAEAVHGDLGRIHRDDVVLMLSYSGETDEVVRLLPTLRELGVAIIAITSNPASQLGRAAAIRLDLGPIREACALGLAPTTSTTMMLALGDALALVLSRMRRFGAEDFARFHPAGSLGRKLAKVDDLMRPLAECRVAAEASSVRQIFTSLRRPGRRSGAIMLIDEEERLTGIFTDSDLARLLERNQDNLIDRPIRDVMTKSPRTVAAGSPLADAIEILAARKISELPVVDRDGQPIGLVDITDVLSLLPRDVPAEQPAPPAKFVGLEEELIVPFPTSPKTDEPSTGSFA